VALADADTEAFDAVMAAYRLPKATDQDKAARSAAVQAALQRATVVPLDTLRACADALRQAVVVAQCGNQAAASDVGVAIELLGAAAGGAEANVRHQPGEPARRGVQGGHGGRHGAVAGRGGQCEGGRAGGPSLAPRRPGAGYLPPLPTGSTRTEVIGSNDQVFV